MSKKLLIFLLLFIIADVFLLSYIFNKQKSQAPQNNTPTLTAAPGIPVTFTFSGTVQKIEKTKYGTFIVIEFDKPIGVVGGQAFAVEPTGATIPFYNHLLQNPTVTADNLDATLQSLVGQKHKWTVILREPLQSEQVSEEYSQTASQITDYLPCNQRLAMGFKINDLGGVTCNPFVNSVWP